MQSSKESNIIIDIVENNTIYFEMHGDLIKVLQGVVFQSEKDKPFNITIYDLELIKKINYNIEKFVNGLKAIDDFKFVLNDKSVIMYGKSGLFTYYILTSMIR